MIAVKWLEEAVDEDEPGLALPEFDTHNGQSAKRRAQDADRKRTRLQRPAPDADRKRTREEKRREDSPVGGKSSESAEISKGARSEGGQAGAPAGEAGPGPAP